MRNRTSLGPAPLRPLHSPARNDSFNAAYVAPSTIAVFSDVGVALYDSLEREILVRHKIGFRSNATVKKPAKPAKSPYGKKSMPMTKGCK